MRDFSNEPIQPTKANVIEVSIAGLNFYSIIDGEVVNNFHVQELRIYEDNCKFYFTGQLVIEAHLNTFERYLNPQADVVISFMAPPNNRIYREVFKVYSYESKPREGDIHNSMVITISLLGREYFKDKSAQVQQNFMNTTATSAAKQIHDKYISDAGGMRIPIESMGMIGLQKHAHQVLSKKPSKAIHDLIDKAVYAGPDGPTVYYRDKSGYVIAPLDYLIATQPITGNFLHQPAGGADLAATLSGYDRVIHFRPMSPPGEDRGGRGGEAEGANKVNSWIDMAIGNARQAVQSFGSGQNVNIIDSFRQPPSVDKAGPGNFQSRQDAFVTRLTYSPKYWTSVPLQTGIDVTVGNRINVTYPINTELFSKTLWVARLIHELRFTEGKDRNRVTVNGTTDLFAVWIT